MKELSSEILEFLNIYWGKLLFMKEGPGMNTREVDKANMCILPNWPLCLPEASRTLGKEVSIFSLEILGPVPSLEEKLTQLSKHRAKKVAKAALGDNAMGKSNRCTELIKLNPKGLDKEAGPGSRLHK